MSINRDKADFQPSTVSNPNLFINGDFSVYQRGTFTANGFGPDRWMSNSASVANLTLTTNNGWNRMAIASTPDVNSYLTVVQRVESKNWNFGVAGEDLGIPTKVTLSGWWFRAPGMEADGAHTILHIPSSGVQDDWSAGFTNGQRIDADLVDGWNYLTFTYDVTPDMVTLGFGVALGFWNTSASGSTGSQAGHIANMKLEWGAVATPFISDDPATNLTKCQRYYYVDDHTSATYSPRAFIVAAGIDSLYRGINKDFPTTMRVPPSTTWTLLEFGEAHRESATESSAMVTYKVAVAANWGGYLKFVADAEL